MKIFPVNDKIFLLDSTTFNLSSQIISGQYPIFSHRSEKVFWEFVEDFDEKSLEHLRIVFSKMNYFYPQILIHFSSVAFDIETSCLISSVDQMIGFFVK